MARWTRKQIGEGAALCLELGAGLLENGAETSRVEESIRLAGTALGSTVDTVVTPTGITVTFGHHEVITRVARIRNRVINLDKVAKLNALSRELKQARSDLGGFRERIAELRLAPSVYSSAHQFCAVALSCVSFALALGGGFREAGVALVAGLLGKLLLDVAGHEFPSFLSLFMVGFLVTSLGLLGHQAGLETEVIVVGALLHRMPGLAIVSAVRDLMAGELVAGVARSAEAFLVTLGMVSGVLACLGFALRLGLGVVL